MDRIEQLKLQQVYADDQYNADQIRRVGDNARALGLTPRQTAKRVAAARKRFGSR